MIKIMKRETYASDLADEYRRGYDEGRRDENDKLTRYKARKPRKNEGGNGMTKVKLPREVAEAIEILRTITHSNTELMLVARECHNENPMARRVYKWTKTDGKPDLLMEALVNGYEVEKTPEEEVREYYEPFSVRRQNLSSEKYAIGFAIVQTLDLLGIKIKGVNA